jgi:hypothetical protein
MEGSNKEYKSKFILHATAVSGGWRLVVHGFQLRSTLAIQLVLGLVVLFLTAFS